MRHSVVYLSIFLLMVACVIEIIHWISFHENSLILWLTDGRNADKSLRAYYSKLSIATSPFVHALQLNHYQEHMIEIPDKLMGMLQPQQYNFIF